MHSFGCDLTRPTARRRRIISGGVVVGSVIFCLTASGCSSANTGPKTLPEDQIRTILSEGAQVADAEEISSITLEGAEIEAWFVKDESTTLWYYSDGVWEQQEDPAHRVPKALKFTDFPLSEAIDAQSKPGCSGSRRIATDVTATGSVTMQVTCTSKDGTTTSFEESLLDGESLEQLIEPLSPQTFETLADELPLLLDANKLLEISATSVDDHPVLTITGAPATASGCITSVSRSLGSIQAYTPVVCDETNHYAKNPTFALSSVNANLLPSLISKAKLRLKTNRIESSTIVGLGGTRLGLLVVQSSGNQVLLGMDGAVISEVNTSRPA